jgi:phage terminase large subunit-like protein
LRDFETNHHKGEVNIGLSPGQEVLNKDNVNLWEMSFKYKKDPNYRVSILHSILDNSFLVHKNGLLCYASNTEDLR